MERIFWKLRRGRLIMMLTVSVLAGQLFLWHHKSEMINVYDRFMSSSRPVFIDPKNIPRTLYITSDIRDGRRLGNQMFNYAALIGIAKRNNMVPVFQENAKINEIFKINIRGTGNFSEFGPYLQYYEQPRCYDSHTEHLPKINIMLQGYYQSYRYFEDVTNAVKEQLSFHDEIASQAKKYMLTIIPENMRDQSIVKVGVHVRRGDMAESEKFKSGIPGPEYFHRAMNYFRGRYKKVLFIVCSTDINWCQHYLKGPDVVFSQSGSAGTDLAILAKCQNTLISVGTFGWWAAWFANGTTIYYNFMGSARQLQYATRRRPYFMKQWIPMM